MRETPVLEMLWEPYDPGQVLVGRFGLPDAASAAAWVAAVLDEHWGVRVEACERIVMSSGNALAWVATSSGPRLAKWSVLPGRFAHLAGTARLTHWLHERGRPVSPPIPARDGRLQVETGRVSMGLQHQIPGALLDPADPGQARAAGAALARLQAALAEYPQADQLAGPAGLAAPAASGGPAGLLPARILAWLDTRAGHLPPDARDTVRELVAAAPPARPELQLVHGDVRSANVLWDGEGIAAILDFEEARPEHPLVETARAAVLLGTRYHDWGPVPDEVHEAFLAGYRTERALTPAEAHWLDILLLWQALAMVPTGDDPTGWGPSALGRVAAVRQAVPGERTRSAGAPPA